MSEDKSAYFSHVRDDDDGGVTATIMMGSCPTCSGPVQYIDDEESGRVIYRRIDLVTPLREQMEAIQVVWFDVAFDRTTTSPDKWLVRSFTTGRYLIDDALKPLTFDTIGEAALYVKQLLDERSKEAQPS